MSKSKPIIGKINKKALVVGVATAVASGLIIKKLSEPKSPGDAERPGEWHSPFERYGGILGSNGGETYPGESWNIPQQQPIIFPSEQPFDFSAFFRGEDPQKPKRAKQLPESQQTAYNILSAIGFGGGVYKATARETPSPAVTMASAMQTSYATRGKGLGGLTALREPRISKVRGEPTPRISKKETARAPVASVLSGLGGAISSLWGSMETSYATGGKGMTGVVKKGGWLGTGMTQSQYATMYAHRTTSKRPGTTTSGSVSGTTSGASKTISKKRDLVSKAQSVGVGSFSAAASRFTGGN